MTALPYRHWLPQMPRNRERTGLVSGSPGLSL